MEQKEELGLQLVDPFNFLRELNLCFEDGQFIYKEARKTERDNYGNVSGAFDLSFLRYDLLDDIPFPRDFQNAGRVNFDVRNLINHDSGVCDGVCEYMGVLLNLPLTMKDGRVSPKGIVELFGHYESRHIAELKRLNIAQLKRNDYVYCPSWLPIFRRADKKGVLRECFPDEWFAASGVEVKA